MREMQISRVVGPLHVDCKNMIERAVQDMIRVIAYRRDMLQYDTLFMNITSRCNSRCVFCEVWQRDSGNDLSLARIKDIIHEAREMGITWAYFSGGEALLRSDVWEMIDTAAGSGMEYSIISNGLLIDRLGENELRRLAKSKWMDLSLESHRPDVHDRLRGGAGFFNRTVKGIEILRLQGTVVNMNTVLCRDNYSDIADILRLGKELGVAYSNFLPVHVWSNYYDVPGRDKFALVPTPVQLHNIDTYLREMIAFAKSINQPTNLPHVIQWLKTYFEYQRPGLDELWMKKVVRGFSCLEAFVKLFVDSDGSVMPCPMLNSLGSVKELSLRESVARMADIKKSIRKEIFPAECNKCSCQMAINYTFSIENHPFQNLGRLCQAVSNRFL